MDNGYWRPAKDLKDMWDTALQTAYSPIRIYKAQPITAEAFGELFEQGRKARHSGAKELDNPYLKRENMPVVTGDEIDVFSAKYEAWDAGWKLQNMITRGSA